MYKQFINKDEIWDVDCVKRFPDDLSTIYMYVHSKVFQQEISEDKLKNLRYTISKSNMLLVITLKIDRIDTVIIYFII